MDLTEIGWEVWMGYIWLRLGTNVGFLLNLIKKKVSVKPVYLTKHHAMKMYKRVEV
jgi:hypothetical protein